MRITFHAPITALPRVNSTMRRLRCFDQRSIWTTANSRFLIYTRAIFYVVAMRSFGPASLTLISQLNRAVSGFSTRNGVRAADARNPQCWIRLESAKEIGPKFIHRLLDLVRLTEKGPRCFGRDYQMRKAFRPLDHFAPSWRIWQTQWIRLRGQKTT